MRFLGALRLPWRLLTLALLVGVSLFAAAGVPGASAASARVLGATHPLVGCAPCISSLDPQPDGTVQADASGKVTLTFQAQLTSPFVKFGLTLDGTPVDSAKIQTNANDPLQPEGQYTTALKAGAHTATVEVDDANGPEATYVGWNFTVQGAATTPVPTQTPTSKPGATDTPTVGNSGTGSSSGTPPTRTLSIVLFAIAGVGLLVMAFIAGMWFNGRRAFQSGP